MQEKVANSGLKHLEPFYMIVPALTINYIKYLTVAQ